MDKNLLGTSLIGTSFCYNMKKCNECLSRLKCSLAALTANLHAIADIIHQPVDKLFPTLKMFRHIIEGESYE